MNWFRKAWRFRLEQEFKYRSALLGGIEFRNEFVLIEDFTITIRKGYAWDGCSPAFKLHLGSLLPQGLWFGTWDGPLNTNCLPVSHRASLVHDALCQFRQEINISKQCSVEIFQQLLIADGAPAWMCEIYPRTISLMGPQNWKL